MPFHTAGLVPRSDSALPAEMTLEAREQIGASRRIATDLSALLPDAAGAERQGGAGMMQGMGRATRHTRWAAISISTLCLMASAAEAKPSGWSRASKPTKGPAESIGGYSAGCVRGA